jgi:hypothetical protein
MNIGEGEAAGTIMVDGRHVTPGILAVEQDEEIAVVDVFGPLIDEDKGAGG